MASIRGWLHLTTQQTTIVAHSNAIEFWEHYVPELRESARCIGDSCELCRRLHRRRIVTFVGCKVGTQHFGLVKVTAKSMELQQKLLADSKLIGKMFIANWLDSDHVLGLQLRAVDRTKVPEVPLVKYVAAIGQVAYYRAVNELARLDI